jgi:TLC domain
MTLFIVLASIVTWLVIYHVSSALFSRYSAQHRALPLMDQVEWNNRVAGSVHSVVSMYLAVVALHSWPQEVTMTTANTESSQLCLAVILGYYLLDVILVLLNFDKMKRAKHTLIHHSAFTSSL